MVQGAFAATLARIPGCPGPSPQLTVSEYFSMVIIPLLLAHSRMARKPTLERSETEHQFQECRLSDPAHLVSVEK